MACKTNGGAFKAVIVGGGPIGLTAAHAFHLAGIDFVLLERRASIVEDQGASLVVYPHTFRVMKQFGILEPLLAAGTELKHHLSLTADGHAFKEGTRYTRLREHHGYGATAIHRAEVLETLYRGLPAAAAEKVLTNKQLASIRTHDAGVEVTCTDGSVYQGSIVIGADGVHSTTRHLMRNAALKENPLRRDWDVEEPFPATYQLLFGAFPPASAEVGQGYDVQAKDKAIMYFSGAKRSWFFLYKKLPEPTSERPRYTDEDIQAVAAEFSEFPLTASVKVKDVWPTMLGAGLTNLGEGIAKHWSLGRTVLVGDACHKFTTHLGLGFNNGVQDVVVLANMLRKALCSAGEANLDTTTIRRVFAAYEGLRKSASCSLQADAAHSGQETRMHAWANTAYYVISRWLSVPKWVEDLVIRVIMVPEIRKGQVLDYVAMEEPMKGKVSWLYPMNA